MSVTGTHDLLGDGLARPGDHIGGALRSRCGLDEAAGGERVERLRGHGLRTTGEEHMQEFLPAAFEA